MKGAAVSSTLVYSDAIARFRGLVSRALPRGATVAVVSRGDSDLLELEGVEAWHFPQRGDGVYLGYYPADSAAAIQHLEALRTKGAQFLAIPASSLWWLAHYAGFAQHLDDRYTLVLQDESACAIYALVEGHSPVESKRVPCLQTQESPARAVPLAVGALPEQLREHTRLLFDAPWYGEQAKVAFDSEDEMLAHYLQVGHLKELSPHPLFDARWYARQVPQARAAKLPALIHFLEHSAQDALDPSPWFDVDHYYAQRPNLRKQEVNALVHYVANVGKGSAAHPNPLFRDPYYLRTYPDVRGSGMAPFEHFLRSGRAEGRYASHIHRNMFDRLRQGSLRSLTRGNWKVGTALIFAKDIGQGVNAEALANHLEAHYRIDANLVIFHRDNDGHISEGGAANSLVLQDYELACEIFRPSALRLLASTLCVQRPVFAVTDIPELVEIVDNGDVPIFFVAGSDDEEAFGHARRVVVPSRAAAQAARRRGVRASVSEPGSQRPAGLAKLIARELRLQRRAPKTRSPRSRKTRRILIPCSDWNVSGVNAALEAAGRQLVRHGWEVEIIFTRNRDTVLESVGDKTHLPPLPYRFLERTRSGVDAMWEALISDIQRSSPCILFLAYDFIGNCVVPALTDDVGVVSWVQADDNDYYEQAYRLGRYCNAVVCVSSRIRETVAALNPAIDERTHVIHNSSISRDEVIQKRPRPKPPLRLIYAGRLVHYQKRILDYIDLARALDRTGVTYELSLVGSFVAREGSQAPFEEQAREHLADGRIRLTGRLSRAQILDELSAHPFFVLLSDFEGLPLALVEAMGRGCVPIVAESQSGIPELVTSGRDGVIVSGRDYDRWADLLVGLWKDRGTLTRMSRQARNTVRERFTVEKIGDQFHELFSDVAAEISSGYHRPPALHWGVDRSPTGDVLAAPSLFRPAALQTYPGLS
jgi:glycosyltransferase involved in cell wall biosynthesis